MEAVLNVSHQAGAFNKVKGAVQGCASDELLIRATWNSRYEK